MVIDSDELINIGSEFRLYYKSTRNVTWGPQAITALTLDLAITFKKAAIIIKDNRTDFASFKIDWFYNSANNMPLENN